MGLFEAQEETSLPKKNAPQGSETMRHFVNLFELIILIEYYENFVQLDI